MGSFMEKEGFMEKPGPDVAKEASASRNVVHMETTAELC